MVKTIFNVELVEFDADLNLISTHEIDYFTDYNDALCCFDLNRSYPYEGDAHHAAIYFNEYECVDTEEDEGVYDLVGTLETAILR